ncbi:MAG: glutathione S-transferase family protein [Pseudomonadales bacterium]|nr:glutathione S-transferase family protein [Pseudomonadales bacterium]
MADLIFYTNPQSRGAIVHWMLEELGEDYDMRVIEYGEQMKRADYLAINPMGKVPALQHKGAVVTEVAAICTYLAAAFPEKGLIPAADDPALADFYRWLFFAAGPVEQAVTVKSMGWEVTQEQSRTLGFGNFDDLYKALELAIAKGPWVCGEQFTAADVYLGSQIFWGVQFNMLEKRDAFVSYIDRISARPAAQKVISLA